MFSFSQAVRIIQTSTFTWIISSVWFCDQRTSRHTMQHVTLCNFGWMDQFEFGFRWIVGRGHLDKGEWINERCSQTSTVQRLTNLLHILEHAFIVTVQVTPVSQLWCSVSILSGDRWLGRGEELVKTINTFMRETNSLWAERKSESNSYLII